MISFIVIGRNEGWKLTKCLHSILKTIEYNALMEYEIIYIDSKSTDDSIERAKKFSEIKILQLTGDINAAIARNVGVKESRGTVLFFIDGDMEIQSDFLKLVYTEKGGLIDDFVSGNWENYYYDKDDNFLSKSVYLNITEDRREKVTGGLFLIKRSAWFAVGGMRNIFKISQDIDLGLRLAKQRVFLLRKKEIAAKHHTIAYREKSRMWSDFFKRNSLYARSLLYRKHIFNKYVYLRIIRHDYSMILLVFISILSICFSCITFIIPYLFLVLFRAKYKPSRILYLIMRDISSILGLFLFYPKSNFKVTYTTILDD